MRPAEETPGWTLLPHFLLRRAGFPFELVAGAPGAGVEEYAAAVTRLEAERDVLLRRELPGAVERVRATGGESARLRALSRLRSAIGRRSYRTDAVDTAWDAELAAALTRLATAARDAERAGDRMAAALGPVEAAEHERLLELLGRARVRDALIQLSPSFAEQAERFTRPTADARTDDRPSDIGPSDDTPTANGPTGDRSTARHRRFLRTAFLYLQRLAAKNETTSFFGPLTHGRFTAESDGYRFGPETPTGVRRREAFLTFWSTAELARVIALDPALAGLLPVRRNPLVAVLEQGVRDPQGRVRRLGGLDRTLLTTADGTAGAEELAARTAAATEAGLPEVRERIERLLRARLLLADLEPSSTRPRPLADLRALVRSLAPDSPWSDRLTALDRRLHRFGEATTAPRRAEELRLLEAEFTRLTGAEARREGGRMYADRLVAYEECEGDATPAVGRATAARWSAALAPYLDLCAAYGTLRHGAVRAVAGQLLDRAGAELPYLEFADRLGAAIAAGALADHAEAERKLTAEFTALVDAAGAGEAVLTAADLRALVDAVAGGAPTTPRFVSPDLMLARDPSDGAELLVLGELHPYVFAWGSQGLYAPDTEALQADLAADLSPWGGPARIATVLRRRQHKGLVSDAFPGRFIEVNGLATRDRGRCLAVADLRVVRTDSGAELLGPDGALVLYTGENDHPHLRVFAPPQVEAVPVRLGDRRPRIRVGEVVVQRARWWLSPQQLTELRLAAGTAPAVRAVTGLRARLGIPRHVFAKPLGEPKPICLDLASPLAVSVLQRFAHQAVVVEEMLPAPDQLWLRRSDGGYTSEFRLAMLGRVRG